MAGGVGAMSHSSDESWNYFIAVWMVELLHLALVMFILVLPYLYDTHPRVKNVMRYMFDRGNQRPTPATTLALRDKYVTVVRPRGEPITELYSPRFRRQTKKAVEDH